jgi:hypothetical protein
MSSGNFLKIIFAFCSIVALSILFFPRNPQKAISRLLEKGRFAIETGDTKATMSPVSFSYHDDLGFSYGALQSSFAYTFSAFRNIKVNFRVNSLKVNKDTCVAEINVWVHGFRTAANQETNLAGSEDGYEPVLIVCIKKGLKWKVISTRWPNRKEGLRMFSDARRQTLVLIL